MSMRIAGLQNLQESKDEVHFTSKSRDKTISQYYGKNVFDFETMKQYLLKEDFEKFIDILENDKKIDNPTANFVATAMKNWAMERGVSHYTHWFQPLTGKTAEKHDAFFTIDSQGKAIDSITGSALLQQETDGSSFPTGGLRDTSKAKAYTIWDTTSPAFIRETKNSRVLCIPAMMISYTGEPLGLKAPLMKSSKALNKAATAACKYFDKDVNKVTINLGWEQEYFVVDEALFNARPDLVLCGRTLYGNASARGQQLDDHYFATIPERVHEFMVDFEGQCLSYGIPITTRHNEVAPTQFECAPHFESVNIAADHNQLLMDIIDRVAKRHKLRALLHEKPYKGLNGSGKHNNWSLSTNTKKNLLSPGEDPLNNLQFMTFFINIIKAVNEHADIMRASIANDGNDHRLGANEAPPAIISIFTGDNLEIILDEFRQGKTSSKLHNESATDIGIGNVAVKMGNTDRNRTSPFPFTGNRFEYRAVGSSANVSYPMTYLNTIVASQLIEFKSEVDKLMGQSTEQE